MFVKHLNGVRAPRPRVVTRRAHRRAAGLAFPVVAMLCVTAGADPACDAELEQIQATLAEPPASVSSEELQQAAAMANVLAADCDAGSPLESVISLADEIRSLLDMGE